MEKLSNILNLLLTVLLVLLVVEFVLWFANTNPAIFCIAVMVLYSVGLILVAYKD